MQLFAPIKRNIFWFGLFGETFSVLACSNKWMGPRRRQRSAGLDKTRARNETRKANAAILVSGCGAVRKIQETGRFGNWQDHFKLGSIMKAISRMRAGMAVLAGALLLCGAAEAQRSRSGTALKPNASVYDLNHEQSVQGTVVKFIEKSSVAPFGAHVIVQTASGQVDVHLGDSRFLKQNNFSLAAGSSVRVIGVTSAINGSNVVLARLVQVGTNLLAVRSTTGIPYVPSGMRGKQVSLEAARQQAGAR